MAGKSKTSGKKSTKKSTKKKTESKPKADPKPPAEPKATPAPKATPKVKTVKSVTLWSPNRMHGIKMKDGSKVEFVNHELEVTDPAVLDELWEKGFRPKPAKKEFDKPTLG